MFSGTSKYLFMMTVNLSIMLSQTFRHEINESQPRIVGGSNAKIEDFPFMVMLLIRKTKKHLMLCGGTYIRKSWVLTASHCLEAHGDDETVLNKREDRVLMIMEIDSMEQNAFQRSISEKLYPHPEYFTSRYYIENDIALVKIRNPFNLTDKAQIGLIPNRPINYEGKEVTLIGWGSTNERAKGPIHSKYLQKVVTKVNDMSNCQGVVKKETSICVGEKGKVSCYGDSGGPLVYANLVIGVASYSFGCDQGFVVYENVYSHLDWIKKTVGDRSASAWQHHRHILVLFPLATIVSTLT